MRSIWKATNDLAKIVHGDFFFTQDQGFKAMANEVLGSIHKKLVTPPAYVVTSLPPVLNDIHEKLHGVINIPAPLSDSGKLVLQEVEFEWLPGMHDQDLVAPSTRDGVFNPGITFIGLTVRSF